MNVQTNDNDNDTTMSVQTNDTTMNVLQSTTAATVTTVMNNETNNETNDRTNNDRTNEMNDSSRPSTPVNKNSVFANVGWDDIKIEDGVIIDIKGHSPEIMRYADIQLVCASLKIRGYKKGTKKAILQLVADSYHNREAYTILSNAASTPRKEPQCAYRLMNILFSDEFAEDFGNLGKVADRRLLDTGKAGNDCHFWERIQKAFVSPNVFNDKLFFTDDVVFQDIVDSINATKIVNHTWRKLRTIWKNVNSDYKAALNNYRQSGTHESDFYKFCNGKRETYYVRKHLELKPNLTGMVNVDLPTETFVESIPSASDVTSSNSARKKRPYSAGVGDLADAVRNMNDSKMQVEFAKRKMDFLERMEARKVKEEERKAKEEERKEQVEKRKEQMEKRKEQVEKRKEQMEKRKEQQDMLKQWQRLRKQIGDLYDELDKASNEEMKKLIRSDIDLLLKKKEKLSELTK